MFTKALNIAKDNKQTSLLVGLGVAATAGTLAFAYWIGAFSSMKVQEKEFQKGTFIYIQFQGHVRSLKKTYEKIMKDKKEFEETHSKFKTRLLGIYYDDPSNLVNRSKMRAVIGFYLDEPNEEIETYFKNKGYKTAELPTVPTITG